MKISLSIKLAIVAGLINCIAWYGIAKSLDFYSLNIGQYRYFTTLLLLIFGIVISIYFERKNNGGFIDFKEAAKFGVLYSFILALILAGFNYVYYKFIIPDAIDFFVSEERNAWLAHNRTLEETNKYLTDYYIPSYGTFHVLMTTIILGIILSLIAAAIFRKKKSLTSFSAN